MICFELVLTDDNELDWSSLPTSLDVDEETQPVIELEDPDLWKGQYTGEIIYNVTFPNTDKNRIILGSMLSGSSYKLERKEFNIVAIYNGEIMNVDKMYAVKNGFDGDGRFEVQLYNSSNWVKQASEKKINTIKILDARFAHSPWQIDNVNNLGAKYNDGDSPIRFPFVLRKNVPLSQYGSELLGQIGVTAQRIGRGFFLVPSDFTPWVSLLFLLRKGFLELGWKFECPFLESDYGRRVFVDLCKEELPIPQERKPLLIEGYAWYLAPFITSTINGGGNYVLFGNRNTYPTGTAMQNRYERSVTTVTNPYFDSNSGYFTEGVIADFKLSMVLQPILDPTLIITSNPDLELFQVTIFFKINDIVVNEFPFVLSDRNAADETFVEIPLNEIECSERDRMSFELKVINLTKLSRASWVRCSDIRLEETKLHRRLLNTGATYKVEDLFYDDSLLDVLKGAAHMIYGKIVVDNPNRKVRLLSPYETTLGEDVIEGYYRNQTVELENIQKVEIVSDETDRKRYLHLTFKDSDEKIVNDIYPDKEKQIAEYGLHGVFVDFGEKYKDKSPESFQNTYFKPTFTPPSNSLTCSAIAGYEEGTYSNKGRRVVFALGGIEFKAKLNLFIPVERLLKFRFWSSDADRINPFWAHQSLNEATFIFPDNVKFMHLAFSTMKDRPDWIDEYPNLYELFARKYMTQKITSVSGSVWKYMPSSEFYNISKRDQFYFSIKDKVIVCYLDKIEGYRPCENVAVRLDFTIGDTFREEPLITSTPPTNDRPYDPATDVNILVEKLDCTYFITLE